MTHALVTVSTCDMGLVDLRHSAGLFGGSGGNILHQVGSLLDGRNQVGKQLAGIVLLR